MYNIIVIGSGFSSLSVASYLAKAGHQVTVLEKNETLGGRAGQLMVDGFTFDTGPSFYWMPDVFESYFSDFGKKPSDYYKLNRLDPSYQVYFGKDDSIKLSADFDLIKEEFERLEPGSAKQLKTFIDSAETNYNIAIKDLVYKPGISPLELITTDTITKLSEFVSSIRSQVRRRIKHPKLKKILEFPVLFLGAKPQNTPGFYNFMNYADFKLGTWHPEGGMYKVIEGMINLAKSLGVQFQENTSISQIVVKNRKVIAVETNLGRFDCDLLVSGADYHHTETLLPSKYRQYSEAYWDKKVLAPSALLFFVGFNKKLKNVSHHTLFFDSDFDVHAKAIYDSKSWPEEPLFYASFPSITDFSVAPSNKESAVFLIPLAPGLTDTQKIRDKYFDIIMDRLSSLTGNEIADDVLFKKSFCVNDFISKYNSYKGNAYGLANTLFQTHFLRPRLKSNKLENLYFTGQLTLPGPGVPPALISGKIVSTLIHKKIKSKAA